MEPGVAELEVNVQALFNPYLHLDVGIGLSLLSLVENYEFLFLCYSIVAPVDDYIDVISTAGYSLTGSLTLISQRYHYMSQIASLPC